VAHGTDQAQGRFRPCDVRCYGGFHVPRRRSPPVEAPAGAVIFFASGAASLGVVLPAAVCWP